VDSGDLKLFDVDIELEPLSRIYKIIKDYNYFVTLPEFDEATWDLVEMNSTDQKGTKLEKRSSILMENRKGLLEGLRALNDAEWLNPSNEPAPGYNDTFRYEVNER